MSRPWIRLLINTLPGTGSIVVPMKRYPGNNGALVCKNLLLVLVVLLISGEKTSKPCRTSVHMLWHAHLVSSEADTT